MLIALVRHISLRCRYAFPLLRQCSGSYGRLHPCERCRKEGDGKQTTGANLIPASSLFVPRWRGREEKLCHIRLPRIDAGVFLLVLVVCFCVCVFVFIYFLLAYNFDSGYLLFFFTPLFIATRRISKRRVGDRGRRHLLLVVVRVRVMGGVTQRPWFSEPSAGVMTAGTREAPAEEYSTLFSSWSMIQKVKSA